MSTFAMQSSSITASGSDCFAMSSLLIAAGAIVMASLFVVADMISLHVLNLFVVRVTVVVVAVVAAAVVVVLQKRFRKNRDC